MGYQYVDAIVKPRNPIRPWEPMDVSNVPIQSLFEQYRDIIIEVSHNTWTETQILSLDAVRPRISNPLWTVLEWLTHNGNATLPTQIGNLSIPERTVQYQDVWTSQFDVVPSLFGSHPDNPWPEGAKKDIRLIHKDGLSVQDYQTFQEHTLITVNGLLHRHVYSQYGIYVLGGAWQREHNHLGMMNFQPVGKVKIIPITEDMVYNRNPGDNALYQRTYLDIGESLGDRFAMLSIGGYLHPCDEFYRVISDRSIMIDFNNYPLAERYFESRSLIDLSSLPLDLSETYPDKFQVDKLIRNEDYIKALLTLSQSFIIIVESEDLFVRKRSLESNGLPRQFLTLGEPTYPVVSQRGKIREYHKVKDHDQWMIYIDDHRYPRYVFETTHWHSESLINDQLISDRPYEYDRVFSIEIGRQR